MPKKVVEIMRSIIDGLRDDNLIADIQIFGHIVSSFSDLFQSFGIECYR